MHFIITDYILFRLDSWVMYFSCDDSEFWLLDAPIMQRDLPT